MSLPENIEHLYGPLYDKYAPALYGLILLFTTDTTLAADILTKSFMEIKSESAILNSENDTLPYMFRITIRHCREILQLSEEDILRRMGPFK